MAAEPSGKIGSRGQGRGGARFAAAIRRLQSVATPVDPGGREALHEALGRTSRLPLAPTRVLAAYHDTLLFIAAHAPDRALRAQVQTEFARIAAFLRARRGAPGPRFENTGMPFTDTVTRFSHDAVRQLLAHRGCRVTLAGEGDALLDLNAVLRLTLPSAEWSATTAGLDNAELLGALGVARGRQLAFIVDELGRFDHEPFVKDQLFDALGLSVRVTPRGRGFAKAFNRLPMGRPFDQTDWLKRFDPLDWMNRPLPPPRSLGPAAAAQAVRVLRDVLVLTARETDPCTYLDGRALRIFDLERGLSVAIYGMTADRQLPYESYVGFTLFKNGWAVAYGGAWLFGERAEFGMHIFEPYRGGESGLMMCQVLRVYRQAFGVRYFEVDAHQFGRDNPDGIASGAFWFYHRHGFRPVDRALASLAERERVRIARQPGYRSSEATLIAFTESNVALNFGGPVPPHLAAFTAAITRWVNRRWRGDRIGAERDAVARFLDATGPMRAEGDRARVLGEVALLAAACGIDDGVELALLRRMVGTKPRDMFAYQRLLLRWHARRRSMKRPRRQ